MLGWGAFAAEAPEIARAAEALFSRSGLGLLGTLRRDGSPRISPIEPHVFGEQLLFAAMPRTAKEADLLRDGRCVLHSIVVEPDGGESEAKLYGRAEEVSEETAGAAPPGAWWVGRPAGAARVFALLVAEAALVTWDLAGDETTIHTWSRDRGVRHRRRPYP